MRVFAMCLTLAMTALAGCGTTPEPIVGASTTPVPAVAAPPTAQVAPQPPSTRAALTEPAQKAADDDEIICRNEKPLGTRIGKRVCKTRAQMREEEETARQMMKRRDSKSHNVTDPLTGT